MSHDSENMSEFEVLDEVADESPAQQQQRLNNRRRELIAINTRIGKGVYYSQYTSESINMEIDAIDKQLAKLKE